MHLRQTLTIRYHVFFSHALPTLWKEAGPCLGLLLHLLEDKLFKYLEFLCMEIVCPPYLLIHSIIYLDEDGLVNIFIIIWGLTQYYFSIAHIVPALATESSFAWFLYPSDIPPRFGGEQRREGPSLLSGIRKCSSGIFLTPVPTLQEVLVAFY